MQDETYSGSILFACVDNFYLLLYIDRICSERSGRLLLVFQIGFSSRQTIPLRHVRTLR